VAATNDSLPEDAMTDRLTDRLTDRPRAHPSRRRRPAAAPAAGGHVMAALVALAALGSVAYALYGIVQQMPNAAPEIRIPYILAAGGTVIVAAVLAQLRSMGLSDVLDAAWALIKALAAGVGAVFKGLCSAALSFLGWD
jgi:hypothetical protein